MMLTFFCDYLHEHRNNIIPVSIIPSLCIPLVYNTGFFFSPSLSSWPQWNYNCNIFSANITALCDSADMYWELREDKQVNTFTCTGLAAEDTVRWVLQDATLQYILLGSCPPRLMGGEVVCDSQFSYAPPSRISDNTSEITIDTSRISPSILNGRGRLICSVLNVPGAEGSCRVDYICKMKISMVIFFLTNSTWYIFQENNCLTSPIVTYFKHRANKFI